MLPGNEGPVIHQRYSLVASGEMTMDEYVAERLAEELPSAEAQVEAKLAAAWAARHETDTLESELEVVTAHGLFSQLIRKVID